MAGTYLLNRRLMIPRKLRQRRIHMLVLIPLFFPDFLALGHEGAADLVELGGGGLVGGDGGLEVEDEAVEVFLGYDGWGDRCWLRLGVARARAVG